VTHIGTVVNQSLEKAWKRSKGDKIATRALKRNCEELEESTIGSGRIYVCGTMFSKAQNTIQVKPIRWSMNTPRGYLCQMTMTLTSKYRAATCPPQVECRIPQLPCSGPWSPYGGPVIVMRTWFTQIQVNSGVEAGLGIDQQKRQHHEQCLLISQCLN